MLATHTIDQPSFADPAPPIPDTACTVSATLFKYSGVKRSRRCRCARTARREVCARVCSSAAQSARRGHAAPADLVRRKEEGRAWEQGGENDLRWMNGYDGGVWIWICRGGHGGI